MGRRKHRGKARVAGWWRVAAITGLVVAVGGWGTAVVAWRSGDESPAAGESEGTSRSVAITSPQADGQVSQVEVVSGTAAGVRAGEVVWILVRRAAAAQPFYPASGPCVSSGDTWTCQAVKIGGPAPTGTFELVPVVAGGDGQRVLVDYLRTAGAGSGPGLAQLPQGIVQQGTKITVSRRP